MFQKYKTQLDSPPHNNHEVSETPSSILKKKKSQTLHALNNDEIINELLGASTKNGTVKEKDDFCVDCSMNEPGQIVNNSGSEKQHSHVLEESVRDPNRPPKIIDGITDFLQDEYHKRLGVFTEESKDLLKFWRSYVSILYQEQRKLKTQTKKMESMNQFDISNFSQIQFNQFEDQPHQSMRATPIGKYKSMVHMGPLSNKTLKRPGSAVKRKDIAPELPKENFLQKYELYGKQFELDVNYSIEYTLNERKDRKKQEDLTLKMSLKNKENAENKKKQLKKISDALSYYFDFKYQQYVKELNKVERENRKYADNSQAEKVKDGKTNQKDDKNKQNEIKNIQASDKSAAKPPVPHTQKDKLEKLRDVEKSVDQTKLQQFRANQEVQKQTIYKIMVSMIELGKLTNSNSEVQKVFKQNQGLFNIQTQDQNETLKLVSEFFKQENMVLRIKLLRDTVYQNQKKADVSLLTFYINTRPEDRLLQMYSFTNEQEAGVAIHRFEEAELEKLLKAQQYKEQLRAKKEEEYRQSVMKAVFGEHWTKDGLQLQNRPDYKQPKDKWKVGRQLKELHAQFPHDRVLQRMIENEFSKNQDFLYPEEYDIYDQAVEKAMKNNYFKDGTDAKATAQDHQFRYDPSQKKETLTALEKFNRKDLYEKREQEKQQREDHKKEARLEAYITSQAFRYQEYMKQRKGADERKTLRTVLAEFYQDMIRNHGETAKKRFPHIAYGQDPESDTYKKSFPTSYKRYFFKLVKNIIVKKGKAVIPKVAPSMILTVGNRQNKIEDSLLMKSQNSKLNQFRFGTLAKKLGRKDPSSWRSRPWRRQDAQKKLKQVFMQFDELENCTFEPTIGALLEDSANLTSADLPKAGDYFEKMGVNFEKSNPELFKWGKLKKAKAFLRRGDTVECLSTLQEGFNLLKLFQHFKPKEYSIWKKGTEEIEEIQKTVKIKPEDKVDEALDITPEQRQDIQRAFEDNNKDRSLEGLKEADFATAMRQLGFDPQTFEINDIFKRLKAQKLQRVSSDKFRELMSAKFNQKESERDLEEAFRMLDRDGSGEIDAEELLFLLKSVGSGITEPDLKKMITKADEDGNGQVNEQEFKNVMRSHVTSKQSQSGQLIAQLRLQIKRYLLKQDDIKKYRNMKPHYLKLMNEISKKGSTIPDYFDQAKYTALYADAWELVEEMLNREEAHAKNQKSFHKQGKILRNTRDKLKEQQDEGFEGNDDGEENGDVDYRKLFKTIMCPLGDACSKVKKLRWPSSSLKSITKFGRDCPYAHHAMEIQFPETLSVKIKAIEQLKKTDKPPQAGVFKFSGPLAECTGCGSGCNTCKYRALAKNKVDKFLLMKDTSNITVEQINEKKQSNDEERDLFARKFGILKKASVLLFYGRANDAFDEIAKAANIIKKQNEQQKEVELLQQTKWQQKLGLTDGFELPKPVEKIRPEDLTVEFFKAIDAGGVDIATLKLYISKVCPLVRNKDDRGTFLNCLVEDLYLRCEDLMLDKQNTIQKMSKNVERLAEIAELQEALGDDVGDSQEPFLDNDGNPIQMRKKKVKMCHSIQKKRTYKEAGIEMKTETKYYVDNKIVRQNVTDPKTGRQKSIVCPQGRGCANAHTAIELDLCPLPQKIKNLNGVIKQQTNKLKNDRPMEPWRPSAADFKTSDLPDNVRKPKTKEDDGQDDTNKRKGILNRENVFRKPYEKE